MANYTIIGGDGKQYGPITGDDLRKWISEGRLNAQSLAKADSDAEFRTLATFPELADVFAPQAAMPDAPPSLAGSADWLERDYELDIGACISKGWVLTKNNFGTVFVPILVYFLIEFTVGVVGRVPLIGPLFSIANLFISGPLMAGMLYIFIRTIRGQSGELGLLFEGFRRNYLQLFLGYFVPALFYLACMIPFLVVYLLKVLPVLNQMQHSSPADIQAAIPQIKAAFFSSLPVFIVVLIPVIYLSINWQFTLPLIIDKQMDFWPAMKASWKRVHKHWWPVFGLVVVIGLLNIAGLFACCVGLIFTVPVGFAALMYAYETIFGESQTR
jgi:uncharacterized membrane protein